MSKFKSTGKRILAIMLSGALLFTGYPVNISAAETDNVDEDNLVEEQLKQQLMEGADEHPNGLFGFYETQLGGTEGDTLQINVVRQGGTKGEASVEFKAVDITSAYGKDYVISVPDATGEMIELEANPKAAPLVELYGNALTTSDNEAAEATPEAAATKVPSQGTKSTSALSKLVQADEVEGQSNWRELNSEDENYQKVEEMMNSREESTKDELAKLEGVTATLKFAEGEYKKVINVKLLDDEASESDEQMMFSLLNAASAEIGENYNGYVNILDNDDVEVASFEMAESEVSVQGKDSVDITIKRTSAINQLSVVSVGTSAKTAQAGTDYTSVKQDLVFAPGMKEKSITIPIVNTYPDSAVSFYVGLDDSSARVNSMKNATLVTIEKAEMKETAETDDKAESKSWSDKGDINKTISTDNGYQTLNSQTFDLRLASEVKITFVSTEGSTSYRDWFLGKKKYHRDRCVAFKLTQSDLSTQYSWCKTQSSFDEQTISIDVSGNNMSKAALKGRVYGANSNTYAKLTIKKYEIVYPGYTIVMNNSFNTAGFANNGYKPRLYTARNEFTQEDNYIQFGKAYCYRDGVKAANTQTTVYRFGDGLWYYWEYADNVTENSKIKISSQNVEFKGFQLQKANAVNEWSETIPLDKMDAYTLSTRKGAVKKPRK